MTPIRTLAIIASFLASFCVQCTRDTAVAPTDATEPTPYHLKIPAGLPPMNIPKNNPLTVEGVTLGRMLFYDPILSSDNTLSCASCHFQKDAFTDEGKQFSVGVSGIAGKRNAMPIFNLGYSTYFFWDGRALSLEEQILMPIQDHVELEETLPNLMAELNAHPDYPELFRKAFGTSEISPELLARAVAQFLRTIISADSKYDRVKRGEEFFSDAELNGLELFNSLTGGDCFHCHNEGDGLFSDFAFRNNGLDSSAGYWGFTDLGNGAVSNDSLMNGTFKTPSLRNVALTAPYMHDGRFATLEEVMEHYNTGLHFSPTVNLAELEFAQQGGVHLSNDDKADIIAFLHTLTDTIFTKIPAYEDPFK